jgi:hypothetical protein
MNTVHDYETLWRSVAPMSSNSGPQLEAFRGVDVVRWHSQIERSLMDFIEKYEGARNTAYVDKLRKFLQQWRENRIDGSINRETVELLLKPAELLSVDNWNLDRFFMGVSDGLRVLIASEEELPRIPTEKAPSKGKAAGKPADFGAEKEPGMTPGAETPPEGAGGVEAAVKNAVEQA